MRMFADDPQRDKIIVNFDLVLEMASMVRHRALRKRFDRAILASYTGGMDIHLNPDLQAKLAKLAAQRGREPETLAKEAIQRFVDYDEWFIEEVEKGLAQIESGEVLS